MALPSARIPRYRIGMTSLRSRLLLATAIVVIALGVVAWLISTMAVRRELDHFVFTQRFDQQRRAAASIRDAYERNGSWSGIEATLAKIYAENSMPSIIVDGQRHVVARYPRDLDSFRVNASAASALVLTRSDHGREASLTIRGSGYPVEGGGAIYLLPPRDLLNPAASPRQSMSRWLFSGLGVAVCAAFATLMIAFRRVLAPVDALTAGARALAAGHLDARVDVSGRDEIGELAHSFNAMAEALERNETARKNMVSDVAHELRTPLTNMRCQIESVQDGLVPADMRLFASLREETENLTRLVDDLQQLSLAEAGQLRLDLTEVEVSDIVERALSGFVGGAILIETAVPRGLIVRADPGRAVQVLRNLIANAVTHARCSVSVSAAEDTGAPFISISVADDGEGVPPEHRERIFERFHRLDASRSRATGGAGLGLAIARELVRLHGGTIAVRNGDNGGAVFSFTLPFMGSS